MWPENFDELLGEIEPAIHRQDTRMRQAISSRHRLMATLRFLTSGASFEVISETARIAPNTLCEIVPEVCDALWKIIGPQVIHLPTTSEEWLDIAEDFGRLWDYPRALGAVDGKHVKIFAPPHSGTVMYNYKQFFSFVILAVADAKGNFIFVDVGQEGASNDSGIFNRSKMSKLMEQGRLNLPQLHRGDPDCGYHFIGDDAFGQSATLFKPYSNDSVEEFKTTFNYRMSRARRIVESAFGVLSHRFGIIFGPIRQDYGNAVKTVLAAITLHNYLNKKVGINREEEQAGEQAAERAAQRAASEPVHHVPQNPDNNLQKERLAKWFLTDEGKIKDFDQRERVYRSSRRRVPEWGPPE